MFEYVDIFAPHIVIQMEVHIKFQPSGQNMILRRSNIFKWEQKWRQEK